jgi:hypothetical protein
MPTWSDKLVGEVVRLLLEAIYDPQFSDSSHGVHSRVLLNCGDGCRVSPVAPELILVG